MVQLKALDKNKLPWTERRDSFAITSSFPHASAIYAYVFIIVLARLTSIECFHQSLFICVLCLSPGVLRWTRRGRAKASDVCVLDISCLLDFCFLVGHYGSGIDKFHIFLIEQTWFCFIEIGQKILIQRSRIGHSLFGLTFQLSDLGFQFVTGLHSVLFGQICPHFVVTHFKTCLLGMCYHDLL